MLTVWTTGAIVMAWHFWTRRARHIRRAGGLEPWRYAGRFAFDVAFWPWTIIASLIDA